MNNSTLFTLNWRDALKGLVMAFLSAALTGIYQLINDGMLLDWAHLKPCVITGVGAMVAYLLKNFVTNSDSKILKKELPEQPVNDKKL